MIRRRPVAVYRVIDEEELLGEPAPSAPGAHSAPHRRARRRFPRRPIALVGAVAVVAVAALLVAGAPAAAPREHAVRPASTAPPGAAAHHRTPPHLATQARALPRPRPRRHRAAPEHRPPARSMHVRRAVLEAPAAQPPDAPPGPAAEFGFER